MKDKQNGKKLTVRKLTIANLDKVNQSHVKGGLPPATKRTEDLHCNDSLTCPVKCG